MLLKVVFCGYRSWALDVISSIKDHPNIQYITCLKSEEEFHSFFEKNSLNVDIFMFIGWSWIIPAEITEKYICLGIHPSDLPSYRGGSPIQNQIINGVHETKVMLMTLSSAKLDAGDIWMKEDLTLIGDNMDIVFENIKKSTIKLLNRFLNTYPNIKPLKQQISKGTFFKRRTAEQSKLTVQDFEKMSLIELYDFIRCLTDPYPNAYLEDSFGNKLIFTGIKFIPFNSSVSVK